MRIMLNMEQAAIIDRQEEVIKVPRPHKIKKRKSFMFTTKHHSAFGIASVAIAALSLFGTLLAIWSSFMSRGLTEPSLGAMGLFAVIALVCGLVLGLLSLKERDIHRWVPITGIAANAVVLAVWAALIVIGG